MNIENKLLELERFIISNKFNIDKKNIRNWGGADVIISSRVTPRIDKFLSTQPLVISSQKTIPQRRVVITVHSKELSWLFYKLRDVFKSSIDYSSKYDFFGKLAQSSIDLLESKPDTSLKNLLLCVIEQARNFN